MQSSSGCQTGLDRHNHHHNTNTCLATTKQVNNNDIICGWSRVNGSFFFHTSITIPLSRVSAAIQDIKLVRALNPKALCGLNYYGGLLMRYFEKFEAYLGFKEDIVDIKFFYYRSRQPNVPHWNEDIMEEIEQLLLQRYGGRPHWAKNRVYTF
eukprot:Gb_20741 [translate_table: standard]